MARRRKSSFKIPGVSFSAKRAFGVTKMKRSISRATGIPMSKSGRRQKIGRMATGGCLLPVLMFAVIIIALIACILL